nr:NADH dehydrogenase subunit 5 [Abarenicola claparedi oceanica]
MMLFRPHPSDPASRILLFTSVFIFPTALYFILWNKITLIQWEILTSSATPIFFPVILDGKGLLLSSVVLFISANVIYFAKSYMGKDPFINRFTHLVLLFVLSMNMLIYFPHLMTLLLGWDGLGLVSFILVIYYQNPKSLGAGMITALTNRIGDVMLLLAIAWSINQGHWSILHMSLNSSLSNLVTLSILIAAITKSAQMPFSSWLPAAMAAPTPVSALVHSSTLVTAGVFLLTRFFPFLSSVSWFQPVLLFIATLTMLMAGLSAMTECDLKKIIALSTLSQLGVMMASLGLGLPTLALFHLMTHALFKALLFLCAGTIIHLFSHSQDLRAVGSLTTQMPLTMTCLLIANMALCGSPFLAGFYSKDLILELSLYNPTNSLILILFFFATALTAAYSLRFMLTALFAPMNSTPMMNINDEDSTITTPMSLLTLAAISSGAMMNWILLPIDLEPLLPTNLKTLALLVTATGAIVAYYLYTPLQTSQTTLISNTTSHEASSFMWYLTPLSSQGSLKYPMTASHLLLKSTDQAWLETTGGQGIHVMLSNMSTTLQPMQNNTINKFLHMSTLLIIPLIIMFIF